jgi:NTE family protein
MPVIAGPLLTASAERFTLVGQARLAAAPGTWGFRMADPKLADLVLEGGGVKGVGLGGAYIAFREAGYTAANVAGTSAGAITAALIAANYSPEELERVIMELDYRQFEDKGWEDKLPLVEKTTSLLVDLGIYGGNRFLEWMREMLASQGVKTFKDLVRDPDEKNLRYRYRLSVIASDVTNRQLLILPEDAPKLGIEPDELEVAYAVRMSMSIPIFFEPVRHVNPETKNEHLIVDGAVFGSYPVGFFDVSDGEMPEWPTFGLRTVEPRPRLPLAMRIAPARGLSEPLNYLRSLAEALMAAHDRLYIEPADFARTIPVPTLGVGATEYDVTTERRRALFQAGRDAAERFLEAWDFDAYVEEFRTGKEHSRRSGLFRYQGRIIRVQAVEIGGEISGIAFGEPAGEPDEPWEPRKPS